MMQASPYFWAEALDFCGLERRHQLPEGVLAEICRVESAGDPNAVSPAGAQGLFQFMPATVRDPGFGVQGGFDPFNPNESAPAAAQYLGAMLERYNGDLEKALGAYNWGPGNVDDTVAIFGDNWLAYAPEETQNYVTNITNGMNYVERPEVQLERIAREDWRNKQTEQQVAAENSQEKNPLEAFFIGLFAMIAGIFGKDQPEERVNEPDSGHQRVADNTTKQDREALAREQAKALGTGEEKYECVNEAAVGSPTVPNHASSQEQCRTS